MIGRSRRRAAGIGRQLGAVDRAVYDAIASVPTPALDGALRRLSNSANYSRLWLVIAAALTLTGPSGRRAAGRGMLAIGISSGVVNLLAKTLARRRRPDRSGAGVPGARHVRMPASASFPSGHAASAFAFAAAIGGELPWLAIPAHALAVAVAYSRVHTGVHYPGDVIAGALIGTATARALGQASPGRRTRPGPGSEVTFAGDRP